MKHQASIKYLLKLATPLCFLVSMASIAQGADVVSWGELPEKIGHGKPVFSLDSLFGEGYHEDRSYTVKTTTGENVRFRAMGIDSQHVWGDGHRAALPIR